MIYECVVSQKSDFVDRFYTEHIGSLHAGEIDLKDVIT